MQKRQEVLKTRCQKSILRRPGLRACDGCIVPSARPPVYLQKWNCEFEITPLRQATAMSDETAEHSCRVELPANFDHDGAAWIDSRAQAARLGERHAYGPKCPPSFNLSPNSGVGIAGSVMMFMVPRAPRLTDKRAIVALSGASIVVTKSYGPSTAY